MTGTRQLVRPRVGRFISADTLVPEPGEPQSLNRFSYAANNALRYTDPNGTAYEESAGAVYDPGYWLDITLWLVREANYDISLREVQCMKRLNWQAFISSFSSWPSRWQCILPKALAYYMFTEMVQDGAVWDFKDKIIDELGNPVRIGGQWFEYSTAGNILYGFYGTAAGFTPIELYIGAGVAQLADYRREGAEIGTLATALDTSDGHYAVRFGIYLYNQTQAQGKPLTVWEFSALLVQYDHLNGMAVAAPGKADRSPPEGWPFGPGRFNGPRQPRPAWLFPSFR